MTVAEWKCVPISSENLILVHFLLCENRTCGLIVCSKNKDEITGFFSSYKWRDVAYVVGRRRWVMEGHCGSFVWSDVPRLNYFHCFGFEPHSGHEKKLQFANQKSINFFMAVRFIWSAQNPRNNPHRVVSRNNLCLLNFSFDGCCFAMSTIFDHKAPPFWVDEWVCNNMEFGPGCPAKSLSKVCVNGSGRW